MGDANIEAGKWRLVEVGRVVLINDDSAINGRLATIVEIIDHKRVRCPKHCDAVLVYCLESAY